MEFECLNSFIIKKTRKKKDRTNKLREQRNYIDITSETKDVEKSIFALFFKIIPLHW